MLTTIPGTYILDLEVSKRVNISTRQLSWDLLAGFYLYFGSVRGVTSTSIQNRIIRHFNLKKSIFWHIDYLTTHKGVILHQAYYKTGLKNTECQNLVNFSGEHSVRIIDKFGSSDCRNKCGGHLLYLGKLKNDLNRAFSYF